MDKFIIFALLIGLLLPTQAPMNATFAKAVGHPLWGAILSLSVSTLLILPMLFYFKVSAPNLSQIGQLPWWAWFGGTVGAIFVASAVVLVPKIGIANFSVLAIGGQVIGALILDHFGLLNMPVRPLNLTKLLGTIIMIGGILLVQFGNKN